MQQKVNRSTEKRTSGLSTESTQRSNKNAKRRSPKVVDYDQRRPARLQAVFVLALFQGTRLSRPMLQSTSDEHGR